MVLRMSVGSIYFKCTNEDTFTLYMYEDHVIFFFDNNNTDNEKP